MPQQRRPASANESGLPSGLPVDVLPWIRNQLCYQIPSACTRRTQRNRGPYCKTPGSFAGQCLGDGATFRTSHSGDTAGNESTSEGTDVAAHRRRPIMA